jgi:hypothetical protein
MKKLHKRDSFTSTLFQNISGYFLGLPPASLIRSIVLIGISLVLTYHGASEILHPVVMNSTADPWPTQLS